MAPRHAASSPPAAGWGTDTRTRAAIALGSNLGDRRALLTGALDCLARVLDDLTASTFHETLPVGVPGPQPPFLNAACVGTSAQSARALLDQLLALEREFGRVRPAPRAARALDLDLILFGDAVIDEPGLQVPHPRFRERAFVLDPLAEIAAGFIDPVTGRTVADLQADLIR